MNENVKQLFCCDRDADWVQLWKSYLEKDVLLVELKDLNEMLFYSSFEEPALLLLREGGLSAAEMKVLSLLIDSFRDLRILVFGQFENLKWCVDLLKLERTHLVPTPQGKEEFVKHIEENFILADLSKETPPLNLPHLLSQVIEKCVKKAAPLEEACHTFERVYEDFMVKACHNNMQKAAMYLGMNREELARNLSEIREAKGVMLDVFPGNSQGEQPYHPRCG